MYISLNWLKDFVKIPSKIKPEEIAIALTNHTVEVESWVNQAARFDRVVVGQVVEVKKHPNADRLRLVIVDVKKEKLNIVCGAPNVAPNQLVAVALVGAALPNGLEIKAAEIRGEKSNGMICAEDELGLGKNHEGIMVLRPNAKIGQPFAAYLKADDIVLEIDNKSLSNRPDLLNHYGLARELSAIFSLTLKPYEQFLNRQTQKDAAKEKKRDAKGIKEARESQETQNTLPEVKVEDAILCPRYLAVKIESIKVAESPAWLKDRLVAIGQRPINNIVDLTNYVMFDCGQPLHAFDAAKVKKIVVRRARKNETIETLDEKERQLSEEDLLITDGQTALALAGIMGGKNSEISSETTALVLEAANFAAATVRKTSQRLGLRTESSVRFEKSLDPQLAAAGVGRFLELLQKVCPDMKISGAPIDLNNAPAEIKKVELDLNWLTAKIGQQIPGTQVTEILSRLGFTVEENKFENQQAGDSKNQENFLTITIPSWRATKDVSAKEDLAEEVLRLYGYDQIESRLPSMPLTPPEMNRERLLERKIKNILVLKYALNESYNYSFVGEEQLKKLGVDFLKYLRLANPLSDEQTLLRQSLAPGLIGNVKSNQFKSDNFGFFEFGSVFFNAPGSLRQEAEVEADSVLPYQEKRLGLVLAGDGAELFGRLKGMISGLFQALIAYNIETEFAAPVNFPGWADQKTAAKIIILNKEIGLVASLNPEMVTNLNLKKETAVAELNFTLLAELILNLPPFTFQEAPKYPAVIRDLAFVVDNKILYNDFRAEIVGFDSLLKEIELFDVYRGPKLPENQKSLAFHLSYRAADRTLTAAEVDQIQTKLIKHLADTFGAKLRDF